MNTLKKLFFIALVLWIKQGKYNLFYVQYNPIRNPYYTCFIDSRNNFLGIFIKLTGILWYITLVFCSAMIPDDT